LRLLWDQTGERKYETGVNHGVLWVQNGGSYGSGVVWNGLTGVTESPSGAEANDMWADNMKYGSIRSAETYSSTIECYTYPKEFKKCNGEDELIPGVSLGQQKRSSFAFSYRTEVGTDSNSEEGYKIHIIYGATASPSESAYTTINDSPEAITFSYEVDTTPIDVPGFKPTASLEIDTTKLTKYHKDLGLLQDLEDYIYGTDEEDSKLIYPNEAADILGINILDENNVEFVYDENDPNTLIGIYLSDNINIKNAAIKIPDTVTKININIDFTQTDMGDTEKIDYIILPKNLETLNSRVSGASASSLFTLKKLIIPDSVIYFDTYLFNFHNEKCKELKIGNLVESFEDNGHFQESGFEKVTIGNSINSIGASLFRNSSRIKQLKLGNSVTAIGAKAFQRCSSLVELTIPDSVTNIDDYAFGNCTSLQKLTIGNSVTSIGKRAFASSGLKNIIIPGSVTNIDDAAFGFSNNLESIKIFKNKNNNSLTLNNSFYNCPNLKVIDLTDFDANDYIWLSSVNVFYNTPEDKVFLFKDQETLNAFASRSNWSAYADYFVVK